METQNTDFLIREPEAVYRGRAKEHLTSHSLADFRRCPLLYFQKQQGLIPDEDRPAYIIGRAAHKLILEGPGAFSEEYAVGGPINEKTGRPYGANTKAFEAWADAIGKPVIPEEQHELIVSMAGAVESHELAGRLLEDGVAEGVVRAGYCGVSCQSRIDFFNPECGIVDLKTADNLDYFEADSRRYGYIYQLAFYREMVRAASGEMVPVFMIAVEKKAPFRTGVWRIGEDVLALARKENEAAISRLKACRETGIWPSGYEDMRVFDWI